MQLAALPIDTFQKILPGIQPWVESLKTTQAAIVIQGLFAHIEVFHIIGLAMLGGATMLTSLRLIGVGLTEVPTADVEKQTRPWLHIGIWMAVISGLVIGISNAEKLYNSPAFLFKMLAMVAGILFSYLVVIPTAQKDGQLGGGARIALYVSLAIWVLGLVVFLTADGANPGFFHLTWFGAIMAFLSLQGKMRNIFTLGAAVIIVAWQIVSHVVLKDPYAPEYQTANIIFMVVLNAWVFGLMFLNITGKAAAPGSSGMARLIGYAAILVWVTVGAGGRWIGLS